MGKIGLLSIIGNRFKKESLVMDGNKYLDGGRYNEALESFDKALKVDSRYVKAWYNKGILLEKLKDIRKLLNVLIRL